jgi:hypothetical protein
MKSYADSYKCRRSLNRILFIFQADDLDSTDPHNQQQHSLLTPSLLLHPHVLPRVHSSIFMLYALYYKRDDDEYWMRILKWNRKEGEFGNENGVTIITAKVFDIAVLPGITAINPTRQTSSCGYRATHDIGPSHKERLAM